MKKLSPEIILFIIFLPLVFGIGAYFFGHDLGKKEGVDTTLEISKIEQKKLEQEFEELLLKTKTTERIKGYEDGFKIGSSNNPKEESTVLRKAFMGAKITLLNEDLIKKHHYQTSVNALGLTDSIKRISNVIQVLSNKENQLILKSLVTIGNLSKSEEEILLDNYEDERATINAQVLEEYRRGIKLNELKNRDLRNTVEKTEAFTAAHKGIVCEIVELLSPYHKFKIAKHFLEAGKNYVASKAKRRSEMLVLSDAEIAYVSNALCELIIETGINNTAKLYHDYALMLDFNSEYLVKDQMIKNTMKLVSAELTTTSVRTKEFDRGKWAVNPKYTISSRSTVSAGVNLNKFFQIVITRNSVSKSGKTEIKIVVPNPEILSIDVDIDPESNNTILATKLKDSELESLISEEKSIARSQAISNNIIAQAKVSAENALNILYKPMLRNSSGDYQLIVEFTNEVPNYKNMVLLN